MSFTQRTQRSQSGTAPSGFPVSIFHSSFFIMPFPADEFHAKDAKGCRPVGLPLSFILHFSLCISLTAPSGFPCLSFFIFHSSFFIFHHAFP
jgi:hypothetical protein